MHQNNCDNLFETYAIRQGMEIKWRVVLPIALIIGVIFIYFVRVKPIEGFGTSKDYSNGKYFDEQEENVSYNCNA